MDATVKLTLGKEGCQHVTADITINGQTHRITDIREDLLKDDLDPLAAAAIVRANLRAYLKIEAANAAKTAKPLDWSAASTAIEAKVFKV